MIQPRRMKWRPKEPITNEHLLIKKQWINCLIIIFIRIYVNTQKENCEISPILQETKGIPEICCTDHAPNPHGYDPKHRMELKQFPLIQGCV